MIVITLTLSSYNLKLIIIVFGLDHNVYSCGSPLFDDGLEVHTNFNPCSFGNSANILKYELRLQFGVTLYCAYTSTRPNE